MKKRNCRMTPAEREQHERATKIRKMTDEQLCGYIDGLKDTGQQICPTSIRRQAVEDFVSSIRPGNGIGQATIAKLREFAKANGDIL